jgi:glycosyltransferase involved in cell wall biosynthesis
MRQITAVIITKNEERNIGRCLDSLIGVVDQLLVVDSGSTDETSKICKEKGADVYTRTGETNKRNMIGFFQ